MRAAAVVLAAGAGRRIGRPKALLPIGEETFLERVLGRLREGGAEPLVVVLAPGATRERSLPGLPRGVRFVENDRPERGMLSSALVGLDAADALGADALLLQPVDHPLVEPATVARVIAALADARIAVPAHGGRRGHPGGFRRDTWSELRGAPPDVGARGVLSAHPDWIAHVEGGPECRAGVDTPEDYQRWVGVPLP